MRVRASGGTLTAGELREALDRLDDATPIFEHGEPVLEAEVTGEGLDLRGVDRPGCDRGCLEW